MNKILVVDDDSVFRGMLVSVIADKYPEAEIVQASSGTEGRDKFSEDSFDIVVTDFEMPGMNGLELLKYIKGNSADGFSAIMVSGLQNSLILQINVEDLGFKFLRKPFRLQELYELLPR